MTAPFRYSAIDPSGRRLAGVEAALNAAALTSRLESRGMVVLEVRESAAEAEAKRSGRVGSKRREVLEVTRAIAALLPAGMPLARALATSAGIASGPVATAIEQIRAQVERGEPLAKSLSEHPQLFPPIYVGLVRAGERSGDLPGAFARIAAQLEREEQLRARLLSVSIYPILLAVAGGIAVLVLLFLVIPRFIDLLQGTGAMLPRSTQLLLTLSDLLRSYWFLVLAAPVAGAMLLWWMRTTDEGRAARSRLLLSLPVLREFRRHTLAGRFARLLGTLLGGGAPLLASLNDTIESIGDPIAREETTRIRTEVREGSSLNRALTAGILYPPILAQLVSVGEESGQLQSFLLKAAEILEERTDRALQRLVALIEPAMILLFGGIVGFVALSLLQAIYSVNAGSFR